MSKPDSTGGSIDTRERFEQALETVVARARSNSVHVEGACEARTSTGQILSIEIAEDVPPSDRTRFAPTGDRASNDLSTVDITSPASLVQVLTGLPLGREEGRSTCSAFADGLRDGESVTGTARKPIEGFRWRIGDLYCQNCSRDELQHPRFGRTDALFEATVAEASSTSKQKTWTVAADVRVVDYSPPSEGPICQ